MVEPNLNPGPPCSRICVPSAQNQDTGGPEAEPGWKVSSCPGPRMSFQHLLSNWDPQESPLPASEITNGWPLVSIWPTDMTGLADANLKMSQQSTWRNWDVSNKCTEFPFLLNNRASCGVQWAGSSRQAGHVLSVCHRPRLASHTCPHDQRLSELAPAPGSRPIAQTSPHGLRRSWMEKALLPVPCLGPRGVGRASLGPPPTPAQLHLTHSLIYAGA